MRRQIPAAAALAAALLATAAAAAPKPAVHKPAAAKPATDAPAAAPAPTGPFDARNPDYLIALLAGMQAQATVAERQDDTVSLKVVNPAYGFSAQFAGCDPHGRVCKALAFSGLSEQRTVTLAEINRFNQTTINCHAFMDNGGKPHAWYSTLVFESTTRADMITHIQAWQGCWATFGAFLKSPTDYLSAAP
ncbi:MAG: hypothetical protein E7812_04115 [Phenylobacterium sp.]|nr:MAG: hypothetical protein E7812_04115 [Phenylobacterium sp.]